jgi:uncharacterized protein (TIGR00661 family)
MAKILYGVMGNTHGHVMRTRAILDRWRGHEVQFVGGGRVIEAFEKDYKILKVPVWRTVHKKQSVDLPATIGQIFLRLSELPSTTKQICKLIDSWQPDIAICDREFFLPFACDDAGLRCVSVNHSHVLLCCKYEVPMSQKFSWALAEGGDRLFFDHIHESCITSFYHLPIRKGRHAKLFAPVVRKEVKERKSATGDHILVYQTSPTFKQLIDAVSQLKRPVIVYGFSKKLERAGNITFKPYDTESILDDLASCSYAVVNGGHNLISEALYYHKPVMCFPIANLFEQYLNAYHVKKLGYGDFSLSRDPQPELFYDFENHLHEFRKNITPQNFDGTDELVSHLQKLLPQ